jgi:sigma-B regulation protein RsbU (phosphoserine phosphatase)
VESARDPAAIVSWVNDRLTAHNPHLMFVTLLVGILSLDDGEFVWCNAGHPPLLSRLPDGSITVLQGRSGPACGVRSQWSYRAFSHRTLPGETLFGYTDGATEAVDGEGNQYGEARLTAAMAATPLDSKMQALIERLAADVQAFASGTEQFDDITLIAAKRT